MNTAYLAIDKNGDIHERESKFWLSRNVSSVRATSMYEGIEKAANTQFLYIAINAENINYQSELPILRAATNDLIFVSTTKYTMQEQGVAVRLGADLFGQLSDDPNDNYTTVMNNINGLNERAKRRKSPVKLLFYGNILIYPAHHQVFIDDVEVELTKTEFNMLCYFCTNRGKVLSAEQIYSNVWGHEHAEYIEVAVRSSIKRLRKKIGGQDADGVLIENVRDVGYRLPAKYEHKHHASL